MKNCTYEATKVDNLGLSIEGALAEGARLQMAYAWFPPGAKGAEVRYVATTPLPGAFFGWRVQVDDSIMPSMVERSPLLSWYEREMMEMSGVEFVGNPEPERLLTATIGEAAQTPLGPAKNGDSFAHTLADPVLPQVSGKHVQLLPFGPVRADVLESAQFIFYYIGEGILHYHPHLFFKHRGVEKQFEGMDVRLGALLAERVSGVDTVAHALAYAQAVEDALECEVPRRARWTRTVAAELERIYNHLHYLGHLCHTTTLKVGEAQGKLLEEQAKQINGIASGSRFLRGVVCPGGIRRDLDLVGLLDGIQALENAFETYVNLIERTTSHLDRLISTGLLTQKLAFDQGATGPIERASGIDRDLRRDHCYAAYDELRPAVASHEAGDAYARMQVRINELRASFALLKFALEKGAPRGSLASPCEAKPRAEGVGWTESSRGTVLYAVHLDETGRLSRTKIKSASFSNWRVFAFTVHDSNMMDYAINEASFGLTISACAR
jgi:formate hydrogenlyase subunit 5